MSCAPDPYVDYRKLDRPRSLEPNLAIPITPIGYPNETPNTNRIKAEIDEFKQFLPNVTVVADWTEVLGKIII